MTQIRFSRIPLDVNEFNRIKKNQTLFIKSFKIIKITELLPSIEDEDLKNYEQIEEIADALLEIFEQDKAKIGIWNIRLLPIRFLSRIANVCIEATVGESNDQVREILIEFFNIVLHFYHI